MTIELDINASRDEKLLAIPSSGMNIFKIVELYTKYRKVIPKQHWHEDLYSKPDEKIIQAVRKERNTRKEFKKELNIEKKKVQNSLKAEKKDRAATKC